MLNIIFHMKDFFIVDCDSIYFNKYLI